MAVLDRALGGWRVWIRGEVVYTTTDRSLAQAWMDAYHKTLVQFAVTTGVQ